jgi:hypothetical protein
LVDSSIIPYISEELFYFITKNIPYLCGILAFRNRLLNYKVVGSEFEKGLDFIDKMYGISNHIPIYQKSLFEMIEQYLD